MIVIIPNLLWVEIILGTAYFNHLESDDVISLYIHSERGTEWEGEREEERGKRDENHFLSCVCSFRVFEIFYRPTQHAGPTSAAMQHFSPGGSLIFLLSAKIDGEITCFQSYWHHISNIYCSFNIFRVFQNKTSHKCVCAANPII